MTEDIVKEKYTTKQDGAIRIVISGDPHIYSKDYGQHIDYPKECITTLHIINKELRELQANVYIDTGDFGGQFNKLKFRGKIEEILDEQLNITGGNRFSLRGNHDYSSSDDTEWEYYYSRGVIKIVPYFDAYNVRIHLVSFGEEQNKLNIRENASNIAVVHNFVMFSGDKTPPWGKPIILDNHIPWYGVDMIIAGHIHEEFNSSGYMSNGETSKKVALYYPGAPTRPAYHNVTDFGNLVVIDALPSGETNIGIDRIELLKVTEIFMVEQAEVAKIKKQNKLDIADVIEDIESYDKNSIGDPIELINSYPGISDNGKKVAITLLMEAMGA